MAHPDRTPPPTPEAGAVRAAADLVGVLPLAKKLGVADRTVYHWMDGKRVPRVEVLTEIRQHLVEHRQLAGRVIAAIRAVEEGKIT